MAPPPTPVPLCGARGDCVGAFGECSRDLHSLLHDTVRSAAERHWREAGATSARAATPVYCTPYTAILNLL